MNEPKIPVFIAVGFWVASGLAVMSYTLISFKKTATGAEELAGAVIAGPAGLLVADAGVLAAEGSGLAPTNKQLNRNKFKPSR